MGKSAAQREKERRRTERLEAQQDDVTRRSRRKRLAALVLVLAIVGMFLATIAAGFTGSNDQAQSTATTTTSVVPTTVAPPVSLTVPPKGEAITGDTPCPATDGSSARVTSFEKAPPMCIDPAKEYQAILHTSEGDITVFLNASEAPNTVNNFVVLSRYHFYDGVPFFRMRPQMMIVTGDATGDPEVGAGGPGYTFPAEIPEAGVVYGWGTLAMWNESKDANGSRFFIVTGEQAAALPPEFTAFGLVSDGAEPVHAIETKGDPTTGAPFDDVVIESVEIRELADDTTSTTTS